MLRMRNMARIAPDSPDPLAPALRKLIARLCHYRGAAVLQAAALPAAGYYEWEMRLPRSASTGGARAFSGWCSSRTEVRLGS